MVEFVVVEAAVVGVGSVIVTVVTVGVSVAGKASSVADILILRFFLKQ